MALEQREGRTSAHICRYTESYANLPRFAAAKSEKRPLFGPLNSLIDVHRTDKLLAVGKQCGRAAGVNEHHVLIARQRSIANVID